MKNLFSRLLLSIFLLNTFGIQTVFTQETDEKVKENNDLGLANKWAIQFQIGDNFSLKPFNGMGLAGIYRITHSSALRAGIRLNSRVGDFDMNREELSAIHSENSDDSNIDEYGIRILAEYLWYHSVVNDISLFYGCGPVFQYARTDGRNHGTRQYGNLITKYKGKREGFRWSTGLSGACGVEWFILKNLSLTGEYNLSAEYERYKFDETSSETDSYGTTVQRSVASTGSTFSIYSGYVKLGLSIYF